MCWHHAGLGGSHDEDANVVVFLGPPPLDVSPLGTEIENEE